MQVPSPRPGLGRAPALATVGKRLKAAMMARIMQADVDRLVWARESQMWHGAARFRRFIAKQTAVGSVNEGGRKRHSVGRAPEHVDSFHVDWVIRFILAPS